MSGNLLDLCRKRQPRLSLTISGLPSIMSTIWWLKLLHSMFCISVHFLCCVVVYPAAPLQINHRANVCVLHKRNCFLVMKNNDNRRTCAAGWLHSWKTGMNTVSSFFGSVYMIQELEPKMWPTSCCIIMSTHETISKWLFHPPTPHLPPSLPSYTEKIYCVTS